jgi:hypothetical protein
MDLLDTREHIKKCKRCGMIDPPVIFTRWGMVCAMCKGDLENTDKVKEE